MAIHAIHPQIGDVEFMAKFYGLWRLIAYVEIQGRKPVPDDEGGKGYASQYDRWQSLCYGIAPFGKDLRHANLLFLVVTRSKFF
jgi:hypothetical protein